jgi:hypothetical protein
VNKIRDPRPKPDIKSPAKNRTPPDKFAPQVTAERVKITAKKILIINTPHK